MNVRSMALHHLALSRQLRRAPAPCNGNISTARPLIWTSPVATYIICTNPRSGSWLLSEGLASTGLAGNPREWFNLGEEQQHRARWRMDHSTDLFAAYFGQARAESTTSNGVSGIKVHYYQLAELTKKMAAIEGFRGLTDAQLMSKAFPNAKYLWLTRRDKARQAISLRLASSTSEWWAIDDSPANSREDHTGDPEFGSSLKGVGKSEFGGGLVIAQGGSHLAWGDAGHRSFPVGPWFFVAVDGDAQRVRRGGRSARFIR